MISTALEESWHWYFPWTNLNMENNKQRYSTQEYFDKTYPVAWVWLKQVPDNIWIDNNITNNNIKFF